MKQNKFIIILLPAFVLFMGYIIWKDYWPKGSGGPDRKLDDEVFDVAADRGDTVAKRTTDLYKNKIVKKAELARKVENTDNFFAEEVKKDPGAEKDKLELEPQVVEAPKVEEKSKVVVIYRERPVAKEQSADTAKVKPKEKRFLTGELFKGNVGTESKDGKDASGIPISVTAVIQYDQKVINGSDITIRLTQDLVLPNVTIEKNSFLSGRITFGDQRATIVVTNVVRANQSFPVLLRAYAAADGVEGIAIPGATNQQISNDVLNATVQEATRRINAPLLNRSTSSAGNRKVNEQSVIVPAGYELILKNVKG